MPMFIWGPELMVGVQIIDDQHLGLVDLINRLSDAMRSGKGNEVLGVILYKLIQYTESHFATEEQLMREHNYTYASSHQVAHRKLIGRVTQFKAEFESDEVALSISVLDFLCDWLRQHIQQSDKKFAQELNALGVK